MRLAGLAAERGEHALAGERARAALAADPVREEARRILIRALWQDGRRAEALKACGEVEAVLRRELGVGLDLQTRRLVSALRQGAGAQPPPRG